MFDGGDFAIDDVRIDRHLRRRRNGHGNCHACHRGNVGNVDVIGNVVGIGNVGNVRLRQQCFIVDSDVNLANNDGWQRWNRNSAGI